MEFVSKCVGVSQVNDWAETCFCAWVKALLPAGQGHLLVKVTWCGLWTMLGARALWQEASDCSLCWLPLCCKEKWTSLHADVMLSEACTRNTAAEAPPAWPHRWPWCSQFKLTSHCCWGTTSLATQVTVMQPIQAHISLHYISQLPLAVGPSPGERDQRWHDWLLGQLWYLTGFSTVKSRYLSLTQ